jgi:hypothetical protein
MLNWLYVYALNTAAQLLEEIGQPGKAGDCRARIAPVVASIEKRFWLPEQKCYAEWMEVDGKPSANASQLAQAFALLSGSLPENRRAALVSALDNPALLQPELYLHHFVFNAMSEYRQDAAVMKRIKQYWGEMIKTGTPTLWETAIHQRGRTAFRIISSLCHGFGATPINYFQRVILGISPLTPGFKRFTFNPVVHELDFAEGRIPTPSGAINVKWIKTGAKISVDLTVPYGLTAQTPAGEFPAGQHKFELLTGVQKNA